jgi:hypothetical protein
LAAGFEHHKAGRLDAIERICGQTLSVNCRDAASLYLIGGNEHLPILTFA